MKNVSILKIYFQIDTFLFYEEYLIKSILKIYFSVYKNPFKIHYIINQIEILLSFLKKEKIGG